jgi:hypothetical protein
MTSMGNGVYTLRGGYLGMPDQWAVKVVVIRPGQFDAYASFTVPIAQVIHQPIAWQPITLGLFAASLVCLGFFVMMILIRPAREWKLA